MYSKTGWCAVFESAERPDHREEREVEAFSGAREALVVDSHLGRLVPACRQPGFVRLRECARLASVVSCQPGWWVSEPQNGGQRLEAVVAWLVLQDGTGVPLVPSRADGVAEPAAPSAILIGPDVDPESDLDETVPTPNGQGGSSIVDSP